MRQHRVIPLSRNAPAPGGPFAFSSQPEAYLFEAYKYSVGCGEPDGSSELNKEIRE